MHCQLIRLHAHGQKVANERVRPTDAGEPEGYVVRKRAPVEREADALRRGQLAC